MLTEVPSEDEQFQAGLEFGPFMLIASATPAAWAFVLHTDELGALEQPNPRAALEDSALAALQELYAEATVWAAAIEEAVGLDRRAHPAHRPYEQLKRQVDELLRDADERAPSSAASADGEAGGGDGGPRPRPPERESLLRRAPMRLVSEAYWAWLLMLHSVTAGHVCAHHAPMHAMYAALACAPPPPAAPEAPRRSRAAAQALGWSAECVRAFFAPLHASLAHLAQLLGPALRSVVLSAGDADALEPAGDGASADGPAPCSAERGGGKSARARGVADAARIFALGRSVRTLTAELRGGAKQVARTRTHARARTHVRTHQTQHAHVPAHSRSLARMPARTRAPAPSLSPMQVDALARMLRVLAVHLKLDYEALAARCERIPDPTCLMEVKKDGTRGFRRRIQVTAHPHAQTHTPICTHPYARLQDEATFRTIAIWEDLDAVATDQLLLR